jgi:uncharacterized membrane protein
MKLVRNASALLCAGIGSLALVGAAFAQPPAPTGAPTAGPSGPTKPTPGGGPSGPSSPGGGPGPSSPGGPGGSGPGPGTPTANFNLVFCNKSQNAPKVFIAIAAITGKQFRVQGWTQVPQGQCQPVGSFQRPRVWFHAQSGTGISWNANPDVDLCVNLNGGFEYTWDGTSRTCGQGETAVPFVKIEMPANNNTFTMTLN